jgi:LysM repeat protein
MGNAQETIIKHTVEKGETVSQLSRKYNVSLEDIYALNPSAVDIIKIGEVLSIPRSEGQNQSITTSTSISSNSDTITYAVVYGDTKYSLARRFGISIEEFERQNPHTKNGLQAGHILKIQGQENTSASSGNVTIRKTHVVLKGQTLWGISKQNELTVDQLVNANADILSGILQIGQVLRIPAPSSVNDSNSDTYLVQRGDTKYGLSKKYEVSIAELEEVNPHIVRMLMAGHTIQIPRETNVAENKSTEEIEPEEILVTTIEIPNEDSKPISIDSTNTAEVVISEENTAEKVVETSNLLAYENYEIQPKETLYGLSKKAGMSISDFVTLNPQLANGVQIGTIVKMPSNGSNQEQPIVKTEPVFKKSNQRYVDLSLSIKTVKRNQILLFLPFNESQFENDYQQDINFTEVSDEFIKEHLEFYRGAKIAQDSARALGLDFNVKLVETNTSKRNTKVPALAKENLIDTYDAVLLPFYENDIEEVATLVNDKNIPILTTGTTVLEKNLKNVYNSVPSLNSKRDIMLDYMNSKDGNLIVVCDVVRKESKDYISNFAPNAKFIEVSKKGTFNSDDFVSQLDDSKLNYVILESDKNSVFLSTTNLLLGQLSSYSIQLALLDKALIPNTDDVSNKRFVILKMLYPSLTPLEVPTMASNFIESYKKAYSIEPSQIIKFGFDLTFDTLLRTSQEKSFETSAESEITEYTTLKFDYKVNKTGSHDNNGIYIIQYNSDGTLKEIK